MMKRILFPAGFFVAALTLSLGVPKATAADLAPDFLSALHRLAPGSALVVPLPDVKELPRQVVDFSLRFPLVKGIAGRFDARNLLDARYRIEQGPVTRESYRTGRIFSFGLNWQP